MTEDCIFCGIVQGSVDADIVAKNEYGVAFRDIQPKAPVHVLVVPNTHVASLDDAEAEHQELLGGLLLLAKEAAAKEGVADSGYKVATNVGPGAGQVVYHLHFHVLGGWEDKPNFLDV